MNGALKIQTFLQSASGLWHLMNFPVKLAIITINIRLGPGLRIVSQFILTCYNDQRVSQLRSENIKYPNVPICPSFMFRRELCLRSWPTINPDVIMIFYQNVDILHRNGWEKWSNCWSGGQISRLMRTAWLIFSRVPHCLTASVSEPVRAFQTVRYVNCSHLTLLPAGNYGTWSRLNILIYPAVLINSSTPWSRHSGDSHNI